MSAQRRRRRRALVLLLTLALVAGLAAWALSGLGQWLMVAAPLEPAQAIVVLGGGRPATPLRSLVRSSGS
jgi:hypothetical protein